MNVNDIYTPLQEAKAELERRWNDKELEKKLNDFWGENFLEPFKDKQYAVLSRNVITPNMEMRYFIDIVADSGLQPFFLEYNRSKFVAKNMEKYHICKLFFLKKIGKHSGVNLEHLDIVDFNKDEGKRISEITTNFNISLIDLHKKMTHSEYPEIEGSVFNFSEWFNKTRNMGEYYYLYYLSLFVRNGILFENFLLGDEEESRFFCEKVEPSFKKIEELFGVRPLIYPLLPIENEKHKFWLCYNDKVQNKITDYLYKQ